MHLPIYFMSWLALYDNKQPWLEGEIVRMYWMEMLPMTEEAARTAAEEEHLVGKLQH